MIVTLNKSNTPQYKRQNCKSNIAFSGLIGATTDKANIFIEKKTVSVLEKIVDSAVVRRIVNWADEPIKDANGVVKKTKDGKDIKKSNYINTFLPRFLSCWLSGFYILNTLKDKKIEHDRKKTLSINMAFVAIFSVVAGLWAELPTKPFKIPYEEAIKGLRNERVLKEGWRNSIPLAANMFAFRFLGPVLAVPVADKISKMIDKHKREKSLQVKN